MIAPFVRLVIEPTGLLLSYTTEPRAPGMRVVIDPTPSLVGIRKNTLGRQSILSLMPFAEMSPGGLAGLDGGRTAILRYLVL